MKKIIGYLRDYFVRDCNRVYLILLMLALGVAVYVNFFVLSEDVWIKPDPSAASRLLKYLAGYTIMFAGAYGLLALTDRDKQLRAPKLWALIFVAIVLFSLRAWYHPDWQAIARIATFGYATVAYKVIVNALGFFMLGIPVALYWLIADRGCEPLYGFHAKDVVLWPYFVLILLMLPLLFAAGTQHDFQAVYPRGAQLGLTHREPHWLSATLAYESMYSLDYVVTEFFFRGFLILPFARIVGPKAILPMVAFYVSIHFDKPLGECISSFFGGLMLGILALRSRSIYGGVIVHLGIALGMELVGWWYRNAAF